MALNAGDRIGPYEILGPLGKGGMGEVYRGRDTKLGREVAIKILPTGLAQVQDRLIRFEREAKVLAKLNHPNIATIYTVEDSTDGKALVMELVPGEPLKGPVSLDTALGYARQMASALEAAHEKGITHRDLKPANIMLTPDGVIKVLDFGLAAVTQPATEEEVEQGATAPTLTMSPTRAGMILGTAPYMSPEQARGHVVDRRTDIWAFGVVLWELLTGQRLFQGSDVTETLAAVVMKQPDFSQVPLEVRRLLGACLEKDPKKRLRDIGDWERTLDRPATAVASTGNSLSRMAATAAAIVVLVAVTASAVWYLRTPEPAKSLRFEIRAPIGSRITDGNFAVSPDGQAIAYVLSDDNTNATLIHVRPFDSVDSRPIPGTDNALRPVWSPNSKSLAFTATQRLKRVDLASGSPRDLGTSLVPAQVAWGSAGKLLFANSNGLVSTSEDGGPVTAEPRGDLTVGYPAFLSDGKRYLGLGGRRERPGIFIASLGAPSDAKNFVVEANQTSPVLARTPSAGTYLLYLRETTLVAQSFDEGSGKTKGDPIPVADSVARSGLPPVAPSVSVSNTGILAYQTMKSADVRMDVLDRSGNVLQKFSHELSGRFPAISPDGKRLAVEKQEAGRSDIWVIDLARETALRLTVEENGMSPVWSPDGAKVAYQSSAGVVVREANGNGRGTPLKAKLTGRPTAWAADGSAFLAIAGPQNSQLVPLGSDKGNTFLRACGYASFSPDSKFVACNSDQSGRDEAYIYALPPAQGKWQVSKNGGIFPKWRGDGKELYFTAENRDLMAVDISIAGNNVTLGAPHALFRLSPSVGRNVFAVSSDGRRFYIPRAEEGPNGGDNPILVVTNWWLTLKK